jgi:peroxiredoxin
MGKREVLLLVAGVLILVTVVWRQQQLQQWQHDPTRVVITKRALAPRFTLADNSRKVVKLERLLGRHRVVLVFFDAEMGVDQDPRTKNLIENFAAIDSAGIEILAVSTATPFANEEAEKRLGSELPFPVLTDIDINNPAPTPAHHLYGLIDATTSTPRPGLFLINRDGSVAFGLNGFPAPAENETFVLESLSRGNWPF